MPNQTMVYSCSAPEQEYTMAWPGILLHLLISSLKIRFCEQSVFAKSPLATNCCCYCGEGRGSRWWQGIAPSHEIRPEMLFPAAAPTRRTQSIGTTWWARSQWSLFFKSTRSQFIAWEQVFCTNFALFSNLLAIVIASSTKALRKGKQPQWAQVSDNLFFPRLWLTIIVISNSLHFHLLASACSHFSCHGVSRIAQSSSIPN